MLLAEQRSAVWHAFICIAIASQDVYTVVVHMYDLFLLPQVTSYMCTQLSLVRLATVVVYMYVLSFVTRACCYTHVMNFAINVANFDHRCQVIIVL